MKIVSYNLRYASEDDPQPWSRRRGPMTELLRELSPHLIGTQEGLAHQLAEIAAGLGERYRWVGQSRHGGTTEEYLAIFYDTERLRLDDVEHHWLSDTPWVPGSRSWGNELPRLVTTATFTDRSSATEFRMLNTHLDHLSATAQQRSASYLRELIRGCPPAPDDSCQVVVLTGDFNVAAESSEPYRTLLGTPLADAVLIAADQGPRPATFADYQAPEPEGDRIDWILISPGARVRHSEVVDRAPGGQYPSDHLPVLVELDLD